MTADDLIAATGLWFVEMLNDRAEFYAPTPSGSVVVSPTRRGVRVTVFDGARVCRRECAAYVRVIATVIDAL